MTGGNRGAAQAGPTGKAPGFSALLHLNLKEPQLRALRYGLVMVAAGLLVLVFLGDMAGRVAPAAGVEQPGPADGAARRDAGVGGARAAPEDDVSQMEVIMARRLEDTLAQVNGVGRVRVQVALAGALERDFVTDQSLQRTTTQERDRSGGSRVVTQEEQSGKVLAVQGGRGQEAVLRQMRRPEVRGVLVVAEGAEDPAVEAELAHAVQVALDVPLHRITVLPGKVAGLMEQSDRR